MVFWRYLIFTLLFIGVNIGFSVTFDLDSSEFLIESKLIIKSLKEAFKYLKEQPETINDNVILGVNIAKANLQWIIKQLDFSSNYSLWAGQQLKQLLDDYHNIVVNKSENALLKNNLWEDDAEDLKYGLLSIADDEFSLPNFDSCQSIDDYMMKGTPEDSDFCINELLTSECMVSDYCWLSETNGDFHSGYKTSHRLLYFQFASKLKCNKLNPKKFSGIETIKNKLCQKMLSEAMALFKSSVLSLTRDLFMEQIALCGLEGHEEFATGIWRAQVRSWQNKNGCFEKSKNCTMSENLDTDSCHSHVTAVAISASAFFLRTTLKMGFNLA